MIETVEKEHKPDLTDKIVTQIMSNSGYEHSSSLTYKRKKRSVVQSITEAFNLGKGTYDEETKKNTMMNSASKNDSASRNSPDSSTI